MREKRIDQLKTHRMRGDGLTYCWRSIEDTPMLTVSHHKTTCKRCLVAIRRRERVLGRSFAT